MVSSWALLTMRHCKRKKQKRTSTSIAICNEDAEGPSHSNTCGTFNLKTEKCEYDLMCRICLKEGSIPVYGSVDMSLDLHTFAGIQVTYEDTFPKYLCLSCHALLQGAILLRKTAQQSDQILRQPIPDNDSLIDNNDHFEDTLNFTTEAFSLNPENALIKSEEQKDISIVRQKIKTENNKLNCRKCEVEFDSLQKYEEHLMSSEHDNPRKECPVCHKIYNYLYLKKHMKLHDASNQQDCYVCDVCGKKFAVLAVLYRHRVTHFLDDLPIKCPICPYRGRFRESLKSHMKTHTGEKTYQCPQCPSRCFVNKSNLNKHMLTHRSDYDFKCGQCSRGFYKQRDLDIHFKVDHTGIKDFVCNICGKAFGYRKQMMKHQLKVHKRDKLRSGRTPLYVLLESKNQHEVSTETT